MYQQQSTGGHLDTGISKGEAQVVRPYQPRQNNGMAGMNQLLRGMMGRNAAAKAVKLPNFNRADFLTHHKPVIQKLGEEFYKYARDNPHDIYGQEQKAFELDNNIEDLKSEATVLKQSAQTMTNHGIAHPEKDFTTDAWKHIENVDLGKEKFDRTKLTQKEAPFDEFNFAKKVKYQPRVEQKPVTDMNGKITYITTTHITPDDVLSIGQQATTDPSALAHFSELYKKIPQTSKDKYENEALQIDKARDKPYFNEQNTEDKQFAGLNQFMGDRLSKHLPEKDIRKIQFPPQDSKENYVSGGGYNSPVYNINKITGENKIIANNPDDPNINPLRIPSTPFVPTPNDNSSNGFLKTFGFTKDVLTKNNKGENILPITNGYVFTITKTANEKIGISTNRKKLWDATNNKEISTTPNNRLFSPYIIQGVGKDKLIGGHTTDKYTNSYETNTDVRVSDPKDIDNIVYMKYNDTPENNIEEAELANSVGKTTKEIKKAMVDYTKPTATAPTKAATGETQKNTGEGETEAKPATKQKTVTSKDLN